MRVLLLSLLFTFGCVEAEPKNSAAAPSDGDRLRDLNGEQRAFVCSNYYRQAECVIDDFSIELSGDYEGCLDDLASIAEDCDETVAGLKRCVDDVETCEQVPKNEIDLCVDTLCALAR